MKPARPRVRTGFTLIEIITAMGVFSIIGLLLVMFLRNSYTIYQRGQVSVALNDESHALTTRMINGLRGTFKVISANDNSVIVLSYFAPNDSTPTQVTITKNASSLSLSTIQGVAQAGGGYVYDPGTAKTRTISTHLVSNPPTPLFQYYNESNTLLASPPDIAAIHLIKVTTTIFSVLNTNKTASATTRVELRNLKTNL